MILAEKIIKLRKQNGWSQEDLALHMGVSRQSVSKWESMSSLPDLDKVIKLSSLFGVSTDYLLKDDMEEELGFEVESATTNSPSKMEETYVNVSLDEANNYITLVEKTSKRIASAVAACILSPVVLILLAGYAEAGTISISENIASGIGSAVLLIMIAGAVFIFVSDGIQLSKYDYLEKENLDLQYGIAGIVESKKESHDPKYKTSIAIGVALCILSVVPILVASGFDFPDSVYNCLVSLLLIFIACGVFLFVRFGMVHDCYKTLLEEGEYTRENKMNAKRNDTLSTIYWAIITAAYLGYSFITGAWDRSWIIWPVAGVLFAAIIGVANSLRKK